MISTEEAEKKADEAASRSAFNLRAYVVGGDFMISRMLFELGMKGARNIEDCDFLVFTGGEDVSPNLYGEKPIPETGNNPERDEREVAIFEAAKAAKKPMVGICRGSQFLNAMQEGGKLWQDVNNHTRSHSVLDCRTGEERHEMTSTHHQQMIPGKNAEVLALASLSTMKKSFGAVVNRDKPDYDDVEIVWYPDTLCLCFQPHPEYHPGGCRDYFTELLDEFIVTAC